ncbi:uncharacterized protein LOC111252663 isoform X2 [Varroa destructor]|uniref:Uncharacterized protein n=2 Tax=Varroa destructor TaxID=109461 RepID=A0A7M7KW09_VARDE|nr:uncharacterized protein LOC111252663 isoform X2 [Varroa destructor]
MCARQFLSQFNSNFWPSATEKMSGFAPRILELLRQHEYPGSELFTEVDVEILAQDKNVAAFFTKIAEMDRSLFLTKEQSTVLQLAGELNDLQSIPLDAVSARQERVALEQKKRQNKTIKMRLRHKLEEKKQLEDAIAMLEEDERKRVDYRLRRKDEIAEAQALHQKALQTLHYAQQRAENAISKLIVRGQQHLTTLTGIIGKLKSSNGLRNILKDDKYIQQANDLVDAVETLNGIVNLITIDPERYAVPVTANGNRVYILRTLRDTVSQLDEHSDTIISKLSLLCGDSAAFPPFKAALNLYRLEVQDALYGVINEVFEMATGDLRRRLQQVGPLINSLKAIVWAQRCILMEEITILQKCGQMLDLSEGWIKSVISEVQNIEVGSKNTSTMSWSRSPINQMSEGYCTTLGSTQSLPDSVESSISVELASLEADAVAYGASCTSWRAPQTIQHVNDTLAAVARSCNMLIKSCERMQNDRNILTGPEGVQIVSETGRTQLEMVKFENKRKKELIISLLKKHECLLKDRESQNDAHRQRTSIPLLILEKNIQCQAEAFDCTAQNAIGNTAA